MPRGCRRNSWRGCSVQNVAKVDGSRPTSPVCSLQPALRRRVFGQHLVTETVLKAIVGHLNNKSPRKALDCKTVGFFLKISKEIGKAWRTSLTRAKRAYAKIRTVLLSRKVLALSFNGWTGSGKNFVSKIIAEHIFRKGMESKFVHQIIATHDFSHQSELDRYKRYLRSWGRMEKPESGIRNPESGIRNRSRKRKWNRNRNLN